MVRWDRDLTNRNSLQFFNRLVQLFKQSSGNATAK
jgi:hypothetical protein